MRESSALSGSSFSRSGVTRGRLPVGGSWSSCRRCIALRLQPWRTNSRGQPVEQLRVRGRARRSCRSCRASRRCPAPKWCFQMRLTSTRAVSGWSGCVEPAGERQPPAGLLRARPGRRRPRTASCRRSAPRARPGPTSRPGLQRIAAAVDVGRRRLAAVPQGLDARLGGPRASSSRTFSSPAADVGLERRAADLGVDRGVLGLPRASLGRRDVRQVRGAGAGRR